MPNKSKQIFFHPAANSSERAEISTKVFKRIRGEFNRPISISRGINQTIYTFVRMGGHSKVVVEKN